MFYMLINQHNYLLESTDPNFNLLINFQSCNTIHLLVEFPLNLTFNKTKGYLFLVLDSTGDLN